MGDVFKEQLVKRKPTLKDTAIKGCLVAVVILIFLISFLFLAGFAIIVTAIAGFGAAFLMSYLNVEYEYIFTNGELDIDAVYNRSRRKRLFSGNVKDFDIMAHIDDKVREGDFSGAQETKDYSSGVPGPDSYAFLAVIKGKRTKVIIEPNEKMLKAIANTMTRRKLHLRPGVVLVP